MVNEKYLKHLRDGVKTWNQWREEYPHEIPDLRGVDLEGTNLEEANFKDTCLAGANFRWANLKRADFTNADLTNVNCMMADCTETRFSRANLTNTDFRGSILVDANFQEANLFQTDLRQANVTGANFYETTRDGWNIQGSLCEYVFWDWSKKHRIPEHGNFRQGEFEERYQHPHVFKTSLSTMLHLIF